MSAGTLLLILLIFLLVGGLPVWPYSQNWGYHASGGFGIILLVILVLVIFGRI
jgi:F0F1-type ATP synthase assembly protein I